MTKALRRSFKRVVLLALIWLVGRTTRTVRINWNVLEELEAAGKPYLLGVWHNNILYLVDLLAPFHYPAMISRSRDGEDIYWVMRRYGYRAVRGSASAGASAALRESLRHLEAGRPVVVTPDGPRGPRYVVKPGIVALARKKGVPIVPLCYSAPRRWELKSWDRMKLPKPFSTVTVLVGPPIRLTGDDGDEEGARLRVERAMRDLVRTAERFSGADARFSDPVLSGLDEG